MINSKTYSLTKSKQLKFRIANYCQGGKDKKRIYCGNVKIWTLDKSKIHASDSGLKANFSAKTHYL